MKVAYFYTDDWEKEYAQDRLSGTDVTFVPGIVNDCAQLDTKMQLLSIFLDSQVNHELLQRLPALKCIATRSTGFNHIDMAEAKARGITVCNVPAYGTYAVAEYTFALMLNLSRRIHEGCQRLREGNFSSHDLTGSDLRGKMLGIVGLGNIGMRVAAVATCFGMKVLAYDIHADQAMAEKIGFSYVSLDELLAQSDVITLHVTYNPKTHHLINRDTIKKCKRGAYLINTARGPVVETEALVEALDDKILSGVGLDVFEEEWLLAHPVQAVLDKKVSAEALRHIAAVHYLVNHPRVIVTPHNAFNSLQARQQCVDAAIQNIQAFIDGKGANVVS